MRKNDTTRTPGNLIFWDVETMPEGHGEGDIRHYWRFCVASHIRLRKGQIVRHSTCKFEEIEDFWEWVRERMDEHRPTWMFAHNAGFDLTTADFWDLLEKGHLSLKNPKKPRVEKGKDGKERPLPSGCIIAEDPPIIIKTYDSRGRVLVVCDTLNFWRCKLKELGEGLGLRKGEMPKFTAPIEQWESYCAVDVEIIKRAILELMAMIQRDDLGNWKGTAPGLAMQCYRHRFMPCRILIDQCPKATTLCRAAYYGGQVRMGYQGIVTLPGEPGTHPLLSGSMFAYPSIAHSIHVLDMESAYPWAMKTVAHPYHLEGSFHCRSLSQLVRLTESYWVAAWVRVKSEENAYPHRRGVDVQYVRGDFWTALCGLELIGALARDDLAEVAYCTTYRKAILFSDYVDYWFKKKIDASRKGDKTGRMFAKMMLNSLYGKFGQRSPKWIDRPDVAAPLPWGPFVANDPETGLPGYFRSIGWNSQLKGPEGESPESIPAIAASVTAVVRERMRHFWETAGTANVFYQDTDSLHVSWEGYRRLIVAGFVDVDKLGCLKLENEARSAWYRGPRNYQMDGIETVSGLKGSAKPNRPGQMTQTIFDGLKTVFERQPDGGIGVHEETFTLSEGRTFADVTKDGWCRPCHITDGSWPDQIRSLVFGDGAGASGH